MAVIEMCSDACGHLLPVATAEPSSVQCAYYDRRCVLLRSENFRLLLSSSFSYELRLVIIDTSWPTLHEQYGGENVFVLLV
jgi:hypothetical protein